MKTTSMLLGAILLGPVIGLATAQTINTSPLQSRKDMLASIPRHQITQPDPSRAIASARLPDQYPLETPRGLIEVSDLMLHGLYSNPRFYPSRSYTGIEPVSFEAAAPPPAPGANVIVEPIRNVMRVETVKQMPGIEDAAVRRTGKGAFVVVEDIAPIDNGGRSVVPIPRNSPIYARGDLQKTATANVGVIFAN